MLKILFLKYIYIFTVDQITFYDVLGCARNTLVNL